MDKLKELFTRYKEIIMYLIFGVLTTLVGMGSYFLILKAGISLGFADDAGEPTNVLRLTAQVLQ